jgi:hypothetical protein
MVAWLGLCGFNYASGELEDRVGAEAAGDAAGADSSADLYYAVLPVQIDEVERELHGEGVDSLAGYDPEAFAGAEAGAAKEALVAAGGGVGHLDPVANFSLARGVEDPHEFERAGHLLRKQVP